MYYISAKYFYQAGTFNTKENGAYCHQDNCERETFKTKKEAIDFIVNTLNCEEYATNKFTPKGVWVLNHGEYSSPEFRVLKVRNS